MQNIENLITRAFKTLYDIEFRPDIAIAPKSELGEYCIGVFQLAKPLGKSPNIIAEEVVVELAKHSDTFMSTNAFGGYVNFFLTDTVWISLFSELNLQTCKPAHQQTIIVDYIGANAGKPLHIAHICTPSIGQTICNVYRHLGYRVIGDSHFGDWGGIFGKLIWAWKYENLIRIAESNELCLSSLEISMVRESSEENKISGRHQFLSTLLEKKGIILLYILYLKFHIQISLSDEEIEKKELMAREEFKKLSEGDIENIELWKKFTAISITETEKKLDLLNVHATYNIGESFYEGLRLPRPNSEDYPELEYNMKDIVKELIEKGIATQNEDGSVGVVFPDDAKLPSCILQKKDGTGLYLTSDLAAIKYRLTNSWNPKKIIYSVDVRQQLHLKQAFTIAKMAWPELTECVEIFHAFNGFIKLKEGAMSTRHGTVIFLEALIEEGRQRTEKILEEKGRTGEKALSQEDIQAITIGAIKYSYLAQDREKDVTFDWDKALSFEGNSGPYIQYAYVRAMKIGGSVIASDSEAIQDINIDSYSFLDRFVPRDDGRFGLSEYDKVLIQILARMEEVIETVAKTYKPHHLALYSYDLAVAFNSFYVQTPKILEESDTGLKDLRLALCSQFSSQIKLTFQLLGIEIPSEM